ncbi:MAG: hypothetical protein HRU19_05660 [Pseudobacteriovorax sp.]|nr:hypothetical protein [Pseudobacteriovorax sp.]
MVRNGLIAVAVLFTQQAFAQDCQLTTKTSCESFINSKADSFPNVNFRDIREDVEQCNGNAQFEANCGTCVQKLYRFAGEQIKYGRGGSRAYGMGMTKPNNQYLAEQEDTTRYPAGMMKIPEELISIENESMTGTVTSAAYWEMFRTDFVSEKWQALEAKGWKRLVYYSRTVPNPPFSSMRRLLFFVPGDSYDRWIQFTLPDVTRNREANEQLVDFIAVQKKAVDGTRLAETQLHFRQYTRRYNAGILSQIDLRSGTGDKCYSCHPGGMRPLSPEVASVMSTDQLNVLDFFNETMKSYGKQGWAGGLNVEDHGPALGKDVGCTRCHGKGKERGPITWSFLNYAKIMGINSTLHKMTQDLSMPPDMTTVAFKESLRKLSHQNLPADEWEQMFKSITSSSNQYSRFEAGILEAHSRNLLSTAQKDSFIKHIKEMVSAGRKTYEVLDAGAAKEVRDWLKDDVSCGPAGN